MACLIPNHARGTWQVQYHNGVKRVRVTVTRKPPGWKRTDRLPRKPPRRAAEELLRYRRLEEDARRNAPADPETPVADFLRDYLAWYAQRRRPATVKQAGYAADRFLAFCAAAKVDKVRQVTYGVVEDYLSARARGEHAGRVRRGKAAAAHGTLVKEVGYLGGAWSRAVKRRAVAENPWLKPDVPGEPSKGGGASWSPEEFERLAAACPPWLRAVVTLGALTGLRVNALTKLEWRDVQWSQAAEKGFGRVVVRPELDKTGVGYAVPLRARSHDFLRARAAGQPGRERVLKNRAGGPIVSPSYVGVAIHRACVAAGLPRPDSPCHALRRTFGRWAALGHLTGKAVPLYVVQRWLGHADLKMTMKYLDVSESEGHDFMAGEED